MQNISLGCLEVVGLVWFGMVRYSVLFCKILWNWWVWYDLFWYGLFFVFLFSMNRLFGLNQVWIQNISFLGCLEVVSLFWYGTV